MMNLVPCYQR